MGRVFANSPGDRGSFPGRVIPKTFKMVLDTSLLNTQQYKVVVAIEKGVFWSPSTTVTNYIFVQLQEFVLFFYTVLSNSNNFLINLFDPMVTGSTTSVQS